MSNPAVFLLSGKRDEHMPQTAKTCGEQKLFNVLFIIRMKVEIRGGN